MSEENNTQQPTEEPSNEQTFTKEYVDKKLSHRDQQLSELRTELETRRKADEERAAKDEAAERERMEKNQEFQGLLEATEKKLAEREAEFTAKESNYQKQLQSIKQENVLANAGISDPVTVAGLKAMYSQQEDAGDFAEWISTQQLAPSKPAGKPSGAVGNVSQRGNGELAIPTTHEEARGLSREEKAKIRQAIREKARGNFG